MKKKIIFPPETLKAIADIVFKKIDFSKLRVDIADIVPKPKDGKNLVMTEAIRADVIDAAARLVPEAKPGKEGKQGPPGKDYKLTRLDIANIASKVVDEMDAPTPEELAGKIIDDISEQELFVEARVLQKKLESIRHYIDNRPAKTINAGISGQDMITAIDARIGDGWRTGAGIADMLKSVYDTNDNGIVDAAESTPWAGITGKPATFPPDAHALDGADHTGITGTQDNFMSLDAAGKPQDSLVNDGLLVHKAGAENITGAKDFQAGLKIATSPTVASIEQGSADNDKLGTKGYIDEEIAAALSSVFILQGGWNADTNTPDITGTTTTGYAWYVTVAGNTDLGGINEWGVGDLAVKTDTGWLKIDNTDIYPEAHQDVFIVSTPGQTAFVLSEIPASADSLQIDLNGQIKDAGVDYSWTPGTKNVTWLNPGTPPVTLKTTPQPDKLRAIYNKTGVTLEPIGYQYTPVEPNANFGNYRVRNILGSGTYRFTFPVPENFDSLISLDLIAVPASGVAGSGKDIDLFSEYAILGELTDANTEADTTTVYDFTGKADQFIKIDISPVFSALEPGATCGLLVDHNGIGGTISYFMIKMAYNKT
jgi:hypothetical protein